MDGSHDNSTNIYWRLTRHSPRAAPPFLRYRPITVARPGTGFVADARPSALGPAAGRWSCGHKHHLA